MCCDSAHKTLPVLTGGGYLHIASDDKYGFAQNAIKAMEIFGSTSPSYLILQSLDLCNKYISDNFKCDIEKCSDKVAELRALINSKGFEIPSCEPLKITVDTRGCDIDFPQYLRSFGIEIEFGDGDFTVLMFSPQNTDADFVKIKKAFENLPKKRNDVITDTEFVSAEKVMSIRDAVFCESEEINIELALGKICASPTVSCPPAIPIAVSGEKITEKHIELFKKYNINKITVVKKESI